MPNATIEPKPWNLKILSPDPMLWEKTNDVARLALHVWHHVPDDLAVTPRLAAGCAAAIYHTAQRLTRWEQRLSRRDNRALSLTLADQHMRFMDDLRFLLPGAVEYSSYSGLLRLLDPNTGNIEETIHVR